MEVRFREERWPLREPFVISRMRQDDALVGVVEVEEDGILGRGECDLSDDDGSDSRGMTVARIFAERPPEVILRERLSSPNPRLDNALWAAVAEQRARREGRPAWQVCGLPEPHPVVTVYTIGLGSAEAMAATADANRDRPILKLKLGRAEGDVDRVRAVREAAPGARLTVDANTGWTRDQFVDHLPRLAALGVEMVEQPFPPARDGWLDGIDRVLPIAADESFGPGVTPGDVATRFRGRYDLLNFKLDKQGGAARWGAFRDAAGAEGMRMMIGCNVTTSLGIAPALGPATEAAYVDLDGPLLLARDREPGLRYEGSTLHPVPGVWG